MWSVDALFWERNPLTRLLNSPLFDMQELTFNLSGFGLLIDDYAKDGGPDVV